jgi:hypothetical protein
LQADSLLLDTWAETIDAGCWQLDRQKTLSAIEKGRDIAELQHFLESCDDMPLPDPVAAFIKNCQRNGKALKIRTRRFFLSSLPSAGSNTTP